MAVNICSEKKSGWNYDESAGPSIYLWDGRAALRRSNGDLRLLRWSNASRFNAQVISWRIYCILLLACRCPPWWIYSVPAHKGTMVSSSQSMLNQFCALMARVDTEILSQSAEDQLASKLKLAQIEFSYRRASELLQRPDWRLYF